MYDWFMHSSSSGGVDEVLSTVNSLTGGVNNVVDSVVSLSQSKNCDISCQLS